MLLSRSVRILVFLAACGLPGLAATSEPAFAAGLRAYEAGDYATAARALEQALGRTPDCARCAHLLGRAYGRLAAQASWLRAIELARKTRDALELAVALNPTDVAAVEDLIEYYRTAPGFLGGSEEKAAALEQRLLDRTSDRTS
jgi:hypothetical protein